MKNPAADGLDAMRVLRWRSAAHVSGGARNRVKAALSTHNLEVA
jgi:hypothetical protein